MYESYFGFREKPFSIAPDPRFVYLSPAHEEALGHLFYGVNEPGGFVLLTGEVGTGKTTLVRTLLERLPDNVDVALILNPKLSPTEFVAAVCDELRVAYPAQATLKSLVDALNRHLLETFASARRTVLVIDEAQALAPDVLEQIRLLTNLETTREKLLEIILVGQPELRTTLARTDLRQLAQRITARYHLSPLGRREVVRYVAHRIGVVGGDARLFTPGALFALARISDGIPRRINEIADRSLLGAYAGERERINGSLVRRAAAEVLGGPAFSPRAGLAALGAVAASAVVVVAAAWWVQNAGLDWSELLTIGNQQERDAHNVPTPVVVTIATPSATDRPAHDAERTDMSEREAPDVPAESGVDTGGAAPESRDTPFPDPANDLARIDTAPKLELLTPLDSPGGGDEIAPDSAGFESALEAWLDDNKGSLSFTGAISELADVWGSSPEGDGANLCQAAGWSCLIRQGDWQVLSMLDLPVALRLSNDVRPPAFVALTGLTRQDGIVRAGGLERRFPRWAFESLWAGEFAVIWPPPEGWDVPVGPGQRGGDCIDWTRQRLAQLLGRSLRAGGPPDLYDPRLEEAVRLFQKVNGIDADGVIDAATLLQLYAANGDEERPRLWRDE
jgi:general secretion pathway protein A